MIALDTNLLVYAHRPNAPLHQQARRCVTDLAEGRSAWAIPWPCLHEFIAVVTHPRVFSPPSSLNVALGQVDAWLGSPSVVLLSESADYWPVLSDVAIKGRVAGPLVHDAHVAALCRLHGIRELWTADRDFARFPGLTIRNPLLPDGVAEPRSTYRPRSPTRLRRPRTHR